ncbi:hypothetical protein KKA00_11500 [bacterium]|nr:hypothetical protein [bacterium]MBU1652838.1 hypothetical protein [bacterium]
MSTRRGGYGIVLSFVIVALLVVSQPVGATQFVGGKGLTIVQYPTCLPPGALNLKVQSRGFAKNLDAFTLTNGTGAISFHFGFSKHVEIGLTQIMYQDLNLSAIQPDQLEQIPDDTYLRVKVGNFPFTLGNAYFKFGLLNQLRYRTGVVDNIYLEPYVSNGIEWEIDALISYYSNPMYEDNAFSMHFNAGYLNHNDAGYGNSPFKAAQQFVYGAAFVYPTRFFDFAVEQHGGIYTNAPEENIYSRENNLWLTPSINYKMFYGLNFLLGADVLLYEGEDTTLPEIPEDFPNYPSWRVNGVLSFSPSTSFYRQPTFERVSDPKSMRKLLRDRKSLFEWVVDDQEGLEYIDIELEKIKAERKKAEEDLEKLKQELQSGTGQ